VPQKTHDQASTARAAALAARVIEGDRRSLARAITLVESTHPGHREESDTLLKQLMPRSGRAIRLGISGAPGVGKSTFIEALGNHAIGQGRRVAVLTVDPSSAISGGSILGDKTRMESLARSSEAFIRSSPSGLTLGGVARRTREALVVCEAAGFDLVIVETVGVGQSETMVADMTDMFALLLQPGGGDELQAIKRGIMELADLVLINKADGALKRLAEESSVEFRNALRLLRPRIEGWSVPVQTCSSLELDGIEEAWEAVQRHHAVLLEKGLLASRRADQALSWMWAELNDSLVTALREDPELGQVLPGLEDRVAAGRLPPNLAARMLLKRFLSARIAPVDEEKSKRDD